MQRTELKSNALKSRGYDPATETLELEFTSGAVYQYSPFPAHHWRAFAAAPSAGGYFARFIAGNPDYTVKRMEADNAETDQEGGTPTAA
jgi:KTSC domain